MLVVEADVLIVQDGDTFNCFRLDKVTWLVEIPEGGPYYHVKASLVHDGGMVQFDDADDGQFRGTAGIEWFKNRIKDGKVGLVEYDV